MSANGAAETVLYVEDEESDRLFMEMAFERAGLEGRLRAVGNGGEALDYLAGRGAYANRGRYPLPRVVLLDLNLPLVSGFEVLKWVRSRPELASLPVVVFSSSLREEDKVRARELGATEYFEKPHAALRFQDLVEHLKERWLAHPSLQR